MYGHLLGELLHEFQCGQYHQHLIWLPMTKYFSVPPKRHVKVTLTCISWFVFVYFFWKIGDPFPILSPKHGKPLSHIMRKPTLSICENKGTDQLRSNCEADQCLCFRYADSTIPLLSNSKISSL